VSTSTSPHAVRCPRCSAHVRTGSDWCTLCYADLRPAPEVAAAPSAPATEALEPPVSAPAEALPEPVSVDGAPVAVGSAPVGRGKHARRAPAGPAGPPDDVEVLANQLLAQLAVAESKNPLGPLASHLDTPGKRVGAMVGGAVGGICLLFILMTILGAVFS
jgi:hypothetical protein